jgi:hypothetical protein
MDNHLNSLPSPLVITYDPNWSAPFRLNGVTLNPEYGRPDHSTVAAIPDHWAFRVGAVVRILTGLATDRAILAHFQTGAVDSVTWGSLAQELRVLQMMHVREPVGLVGWAHFMAQFVFRALASTAAIQRDMLAARSALRRHGSLKV